MKGRLNTSYKLYLGLWVLCFVACSFSSCSDKRKGTGGKDITAIPGKYVVGEPRDLVAYFDSLEQHCGAEIWVHCPEDGGVEEVRESIRELDRYVAGKRKFYPVEEVKGALKQMAFQQGYYYSHGPGDEEDVNSGEVFFFRYLEQAARFCPEISFLADFKSANDSVGVIYYPEWSASNPLYSFLIYQQKNGFKVQAIGTKGNTQIEKIFQLKDEKRQTYYLCSNNFSPLHFCQYLYRIEGDEIKLLCSTDDEDYHPEWNTDLIDYEIVFNPQEICWNRCDKKEDYYYKIEGTKTLYLKLDGERSCFYVK